MKFNFKINVKKANLRDQSSQTDDIYPIRPIKSVNMIERELNEADQHSQLESPDIEFLSFVPAPKSPSYRSKQLDLCHILVLHYLL